MNLNDISFSDSPGLTVTGNSSFQTRKCGNVCLSEDTTTVFVFLLSPVSLERTKLLITLVNGIQLKSSTVHKIFLVGSFVSFTEFPTCEPRTQFICKSGRCISSKWHCDTGKYQVLTAQTRLEPSSLGCLASSKGSLQAKLAEPSKVAKKSGERAAGTSLGISVKDNGAGYLSHGALTVLHFQILFWA